VIKRDEREESSSCVTDFDALMLLAGVGFVGNSYLDGFAQMYVSHRFLKTSSEICYQSWRLESYGVYVR